MKKKFFLTLIFLFSVFCYGVDNLNTLDDAQTVSKFNNLKMVTNSKGNTYTFWTEDISISVDQPLYILKWSYKAANGAFQEDSSEIGRSDDPIRFDAALNEKNEVCVVWTQTENYKTVTKDSYKSGDVSFFETEDAFDEDIGNFKLKAAPNNKFFLIASNDDYYGNYDAVYQWSEKIDLGSNFSSFKEVMRTPQPTLNDYLTDFDFTFDNQSNVLFAGLFGEDAATVQSDVYVAFKSAEEADFSDNKVISRLNDNYFTDHLSVVYNGETDIGTTWSIFWEEATTDEPQSGGLFFLRTQVLNNNSSDTDVVFSESSKTVYEVEDKITDQFRVYQKEGTKVLGVWVQDNANLAYAVFDIIEDTEFDAQIISESGINPVNIDVATKSGQSLITWNTRGQEGGDTRWGLIPSNSSTFTYQYALQSTIEGVTQYSLTPQISFAPKNRVLLSWLGSNFLEEESGQLNSNAVQAVSVLITNSKKNSLTTLDQIVAKFYNLKMVKDSEQNTYVFWVERASESYHIKTLKYKILLKNLEKVVLQRKKHLMEM